MALVSVVRYRDITGDATTDENTVTSRVEEATEMIEEALGGRLLESVADREEIVWLQPDPTGWTTYRAYPLATPITAVPGDATYAIEDTVTLRAVTPDSSPFWEPGPLSATVTYTGGFTSATLPKTLERAIAELANALNSPAAVPVGATSIRQGDSAITFSGASEGLDAYVPGLERRISKYRRQRRNVGVCP